MGLLSSSGQVVMSWVFSFLSSRFSSSIRAMEQQKIEFTFYDVFSS